MARFLHRHQRVLLSCSTLCMHLPSIRAPLVFERTNLVLVLSAEVSPMHLNVHISVFSIHSTSFTSTPLGLPSFPRIPHFNPPRSPPSPQATPCPALPSLHLLTISLPPFCTPYPESRDALPYPPYFGGRVPSSASTLPISSVLDALVLPLHVSLVVTPSISVLQPRRCLGWSTVDSLGLALKCACLVVSCTPYLLNSSTLFSLIHMMSPALSGVVQTVMQPASL